MQSIESGEIPVFMKQDRNAANELEGNKVSGGITARTMNGDDE